MTPLRALTVCQPYAELIARGEKRIENRTWYTRHRGWLAIHAGRSRAWLYGAVHAGEFPPQEVPGLVFGAIVAVARVYACLAYDRRDRPRGLEWVWHDPHACGPWLWVLGDVRRFARPIPIEGARGLWEWKTTRALPAGTSPAPRLSETGT